MKIVAKVEGESQSLVAALSNRGIKAKLVRRGVIVELPETSDHEGYIIPIEADEARLSIDVAEEGGGMTNTGSATIVCGLSGKALRPYYVPRGGHLACGTHAYFSVSEAVVTVTGERRDTNITITEHRIVRESNFAQIESKKLWSGEAPAIEWECDSCGTVFTTEPPDQHYKEMDVSVRCYGTVRRSALELPETFKRFQSAAVAARRKADCYHCRCAHYVATAAA